MKNSAIIVLMLLALLASCSDDDDYVYPSVVTDMALLHTDNNKNVYQMILDDSKAYTLTNEKFTAPYANAYIRVMATYLPVDSTHVTLYNTINVHVLHDSTQVAQHDALNPISVWRKGGFINLHLQPKTQGQSKQQYYGYCIDSITPHHQHISLHHSQNGDPMSYSIDAYASIQLSQVDTLSKGDTISLSINGFSGRKTWQFIY